MVLQTPHLALNKPDYHTSSAYPPDEVWFRVDYMGICASAAWMAAAEPLGMGL